MAMRAVSLSRISPIMMMSGSWRSSARKAAAKVKPILSLTWNWLMPGEVELDGVFDGADVDVGRVQFGQGRVERGALAAAGGAGDEDHAVRASG